jgi:hypothetical protein
MERYEFDSEGDRLVGNLHLPQGDALGVAILTGPPDECERTGNRSLGQRPCRARIRRPLVRSPLFRRECRATAPS